MSTSSLARADVDLGAIAHNTEILVRAAGAAQVMSVIKADAYGHGAVPVAVTTLEAGAAQLGVTTVAEALELRAAGITAPILAWLIAVDADLRAAVEADVGIGVPSPAHLDAVLAAARATGKTAHITPKLDTGLGRSGITAQQWPALLERLVAAEAEKLVRVDGLMAHFANADSPGDPIIDLQVQRLHQHVAEARAAGLESPVNHHANSAATLTRQDGFEMVRPGIALYGLSPIDGEQFGLRPAMRLSAEVLLVKDVARGQGISYGHTWHAPEDTVVALIAAGYADGVWRLLSNRFDVQLGGQRFPQVGRVCMDQFVVNLGPRTAQGAVPGGVKAGDRAVLFGDPDTGAPTAAEWAETLGTIHYEVVTGIRGRVHRHILPASHGGTQ